MTDTWIEMIYERDEDGNYTLLSRALDSIKGNGCDCGNDETGTCMGCLCERALKEQWEEINRLRKVESEFKRWVPFLAVHGCLKLDLRESMND